MYVQDDVLEKSRHTIEHEYNKLCRTARERATEHPGEVNSVTTQDAWMWVDEQAGTTFTGEDINIVLQVLTSSSLLIQYKLFHWYFCPTLCPSMAFQGCNEEYSPSVLAI